MIDLGYNLGGLLLVAVVAGSTPAQPPSPRNVVSVPAFSLAEIRTEWSPPPGFDLLGQEWQVPEGVSHQVYDGVLVATAAPGSYEIAARAQYVHWEERTGQHEYRHYTLIVEGARPPPEPDPPDPIEPGERLVVIVYESSQQSVPLWLYSASQRLREQGHQVRVIDQDVTTGEGQVPREVAQAISAARDVGFPALVVVAGERVVKAVPLPGTADEVVREVNAN